MALSTEGFNLLLQGCFSSGIWTWHIAPNGLVQAFWFSSKHSPQWCPGAELYLLIPSNPLLVVKTAKYYVIWRLLVLIKRLLSLLPMSKITEWKNSYFEVRVDNEVPNVQRMVQPQCGVGESVGNSPLQEKRCKERTRDKEYKTEDIYDVNICNNSIEQYKFLNRTRL